MLGMAIFSNGKVDYCIVQTYQFRTPLTGDQVTYDLIGHAPWRANRMYTQNLKSLAEVKEQADLLGCQIK